MQAVVLLESFQEPLTVQDVDRPEPDPDGAVAEVIGCGVCRSDWHCWQGDWDWFGYRPDPPHVLGHEPTGRIVATGEDVESIEEGTKRSPSRSTSPVAAAICRNGRENICENHIGLGFMNQAPGAFAEEVHIPNADINAVPLPDSIDAEAAAGCGCRFMTSFHAMAHRAPVSAGDDVVIHGCGGIGLSAVHIANALGGNVIGVDLMDEKLDKAEELGAVDTVNALGRSTMPRPKSTISPTVARTFRPMRWVLQTTCRNAVNSLRKGGTHVQIGLTTSEEEGMVSLPTDEIVAKEIEFKGITRPPALPIQRDAGYDRVRQTRSDNACREEDRHPQCAGRTGRHERLRHARHSRPSATSSVAKWAARRPHSRAAVYSCRVGHVTDRAALSATMFSVPDTLANRRLAVVDS